MLDNFLCGMICIEDIEMGMMCYVCKVVMDDDIQKFVEVLIDYNLVYMDDDYVQDMIFQGCIVYGMLMVGLVLVVIGEQLFGYGIIYMSQNLKFFVFVCLGDLVMVEVEVIGIEIGKCCV